jgi:hypothetical protein
MQSKNSVLIDWDNVNFLLFTVVSTRGGNGSTNRVFGEDLDFEFAIVYLVDLVGNLASIKFCD